MSGTNGNGNGGTHKTPVPGSNSVAVILRKIESLPDDLRELDSYQLAAFAAFTVLEATEQQKAFAQEVRAGVILDRTTAAKVGVLAERQSATEDAVAKMADAMARTAASMAQISEGLTAIGDRIESAERGLHDAFSRTESLRREGMASDLDLSATVEREKAAREAETVARAAEDERLQQMIAPLLTRAGNAGAAKAGGALTVSAVAIALAAKPVETIQLLREIGPAGGLVAVVLLVVATIVARLRRS